MFVRAVWRHRRLVGQGPRLPQTNGPATRDDLGVCAPDFRKMTRGLFDR